MSIKQVAVILLAGRSFGRFGMYIVDNSRLYTSDVEVLALPVPGSVDRAVRDPVAGGRTAPILGSPRSSMYRLHPARDARSFSLMTSTSF